MSKVIRDYRSEAKFVKQDVVGKYKSTVPNSHHIGFKGRLGRSEFINLIPNTKYKVLAVLTHPGARQAANFTPTYQEITEYCRPMGYSRVVNNYSVGASKDTRTTKRAWGFNYFLSDDKGRLFIDLHLSALTRVGGGSRSDWLRNWSDDSINSFSSSIVVVPYTDVVQTPGSGSATNDIVVISTAPVVCGEQNIPPIIGLPSPVPCHPPIVSQEIEFDYIQTFFVDPNTVEGAKEVDLIDISVYFQTKPDRINNRSGINSPQVTCSILDVVKDEPNVLRQQATSIVSVPWTGINESSDATVPTTFNFDEPIRIKTGTKYAFALALEDDLFIPWLCKTGDRILGTNDPSPGPTKDHRGELYTSSNIPLTILNNNFGSMYRRKDDTDLKFDISLAEYDLSSTFIVTATNQDEEFLKIINLSDDFFSMEDVYVDAANATGTVSVSAGGTTLTGSSTTFTGLAEDEIIVLIDSTNTEIVELVTVDTVISDTEVLLTEPLLHSISGNYIRTITASVENYFPGNKSLILTNSTANTANYIDTSSVIVGVESGATANVSSVDNFPVSVFSSELDMNVPTDYTLSGVYNLAYDTGSGFTLSTTDNKLNFNGPNHIRNYAALVLSRSNEIVELAGAKSVQFELSFDFTGSDTTTFSAPMINVDDFKFSTSRWLINNDVTNEHTSYGNALSRHISKPLTFREGGSAEDIRVIYNAWRPEGTDLKCYAKIINSEDPEDFKQKSWTLLEMTRGSGEYGAKDNSYDYREYEFGFPAYPPSGSTYDGVIDTESQNSNNTIIGTGTTWDNDITDGDIIKIYSPLFPDNYGIFHVETVVSNTEILLSSTVTDENITGTGFKIDSLSTPYTAFNNADNLNIVRYFGTSGEIYDTYYSVIIKTVLTSETGHLVPKVDDYRVIGVSA